MLCIDLTADTRSAIPITEEANITCAISGTRRDVDQSCALLSYYAAYSGSSLPTFGETHLCPETSMRNKPEERSSHLLRGGSLKSPTMHIASNPFCKKFVKFYVTCAFIDSGWIYPMPQRPDAPKICAPLY
jgi:hypothetical protein